MAGAHVSSFDEVECRYRMSTWSILSRCRLNSTRPSQLLDRSSGVAGFGRDLRRDHERIATDIGEELAEHLFISSALIPVGGIQMKESLVQCRTDKTGIVRTHDTHAHHGKDQAGPPEFPGMLHGSGGCWCRMDPLSLLCMQRSGQDRTRSSNE